MKILIAGGTGLVGKALKKQLVNAGHEVKILSRSARSDGFIWDPEQKTLDPEAITWADAVVNLAGAGIADESWSKERKDLIRTSRVAATRLLVDKLNLSSEHKVLLNASAIGIYGDHPFGVPVDEDTTPGNDFLASVCKDWEAEAYHLNQKHRLVIIRIGIVLSLEGGALPKLLPLARLGLASAVGSGKQGMSWIHICDLSEAFRFCLENPNVMGIVNGVAPDSVTNYDMMKHLAMVLNRPFWLPAVPSFVLKTILGEMSAVVLTGQLVKPKVLTNLGFQFQYPSLAPALSDLLGNK